MASSHIGQLLVEIGLDSSKFLPELKKITQNIKGLEKDLKNMSKDFGDVGKSITGLEKKSELLNKVLSENNKAMNEHVKARDNYAEMLKKEKAELDELYNAQERDDKAIIQKEKAIQSLINKYNREENAISKLQQKQTDYQKQLNEVNEQYHRLTNNIETYEERLEGISEKTQLTNSELKSQQTILEASGKKWKAYNTQAQIIENSLASAIETYQEHRKELNKSETELSKLTQTSEAHRNSLVKEQQTLEDILKVHGETSEEYRRQASLVENMTRQQIEYEQTLQSTQEHVSKVKQSLASSKEEVAEYYKSLKEVGSTEIIRNLKQTSNVLNTMSEATQGASVVGGGIATGTTAMFMTYESGLAKLSTLCDTSVVDMNKVGQDIIKISNETGTSIGEMMEGAYQAVSAGVEIGNLNDFLSTSSKLATSGFTDMSSATKVLSQIMNNYGTEAGNAEEIASKLMKTQNLGVTTVAELSSEMSESLSLASTYGMSFDNVATAFAKITKAGTSTSEAGTAIARMMEELGSSSSKVSEILKKKTGKSFTELAEGGKSLYDILGIIQQYADETGVSMGDLWSSSNAGVGALQILNAEGGTFNDMLQQISSSSGLLDESFSKMADTSEFKLASAINNLKNSLIEIGGALAPVIDGISSAISGVANWINGLGDGTKTAIGYISGFVAVLSPLLGIGAKVVGGLGNIWESMLGAGSLGKFLEGKGISNTLIKGMSQLGENAGKTFTGSLMSDNARQALDEFIEELAKKKTISEMQVEIDELKVPRGFGKEAKEAYEKDIKEAFKDKIKTDLELDIDVPTNAVKEVAEEGAEAVGELATQGAKTTGIFGKLWGVISAHPIGTLVTALGALAVGWAVADTKKRNYEKAMAKTNAFKEVDQAKEYMENTVASVKADEQKVKSLKGIQKEFDKLHKKDTSNMNEKELTRYKELCQQIAEIMPELVVGYDENGNPIIKQNESLEANIKLLELKIKREKELAIIQAKQLAKEAGEAFEESDKDFQNQSYKNKMEREGLETKYETMGKVGSVSEFSDKSSKEREKELKQEEQYLTKLEENRNKAMEIAQNRADEQEIANSAIRASASTYAEMSGVLKKSSAEQIGFNQSIIDSMDFSEIDPSQYEKLYTGIVNTNAKMSKENMKTVNSLGQQQSMLKAQVMSGEITAEEYATQCDKIAQKYAEIYGIDVDTAKKLFVPQIDKTSLEALDADVDYCKQKIENSLKEMLNTTDNNERIEMAREILLDPEISDDTKERINKMLEDNIISDDEILELGELVANGEIDVSVLQDTLKENLSNFGQMENLTLEMAVQFGDSVTEIEEVKTMIDSIDGLSAEAKVKLKSDIDNKNIEGITKTLKELPAEQAVGILVGLQQTGEYTPQQLQEMLKGLPPETIASLKLMAQNGEIPKQIAEDLGLIPKETTSNVNINCDNSEVEQAKESNQQDTSSEHKIGVNNTDPMNAFQNNSSSETTSEHKIGVNNTDPMNAFQNNSSSETTSEHKIGVNNTDPMAAFRNNQGHNTSSTHTITVVQNVLQGKVTVRSSGGGGGRLTKSVADPIVVPMEIQATNNPIIVDDFNEVVTKAQSSLMTTANSYKNTQNDAIATIQAKGYTDTILASSYWSNQAVDHSLDLLQDYTAQLDRVASKLDVVGAKIDNAFGAAKAKHLKDQIKLLEQQQAMLKLQQKDAKTLANSYKSMLKKQGFKVDSNGAVTNATSKILDLEHALESAQKKQDAYNGKSESKQKSLAKAVEKAQDKLNKAKDTLSEYYEYSSKVGETEAEWREIANAIKEAKNEIYEANKQAEQFYKEAKTTELEYSYDKIADQLDIIQAKMDLTGNAEEKKKLLEEQLSLLKQQQRENEKIEGSYRNQMTYYKNYLSEKGFKFDGNEITNGASALNKNKATDEIESIQDAYESYMELLRDTIPDLEKEWYDLELAEKDAKEEIEEMQKEIEELEKEMKELEKIKAFDFLDDLEHKQEQLEETLNLLDSQMEHAFGHEKQQLMQEQITILEEQMSNINNINNGLKDQLKYLKQAMQSEGFEFDTEGNITNTDSILALAKTQDEYDELKEKIEEYRDVQSQITSNKTEWQNLQNSIKDTQQEIENLKYEIEDLREEAELQELTNEFQILQNQLDKLQAQQELNGADLTKIYEEQIKVIEKQREAIDEQIDYQKKRVRELSDNLYEYGFKINDDGTINNTANQLEYLKDTLTEDEFERVNGFLEEYFEVALSEIPNLENEMIELNKAIQDIEEEKLNKAKEIEDEITEMLEKQVDERIEKIEEERDAQIDAINKAKDAYDKWRRDVDYEDDYNKQLEKVQELQAQLEIAKRDDSLSGQKHVADLMEQLKEEQEALEDLVQDRTDTVINDMFDSQIENVEDNAEAQIKNIENVFSETKIAEMVAEAMKTGIFEDIDGNIKSLDTALLDMANNSVEYMGVMGQSLKNELLDNLSVALDYMQQMEKVSINLSNIDYQSQRFAGVGYDKATVQGEIINNTTTDNSSRTINVEFNPTIQIEGTTDLDEVQLRGILSDVKTDMIAEVQRQILSNMK